ncbi:MAG TPA: Crp/Fnr family transcriptional regulator [Actinophytocola sp.]|uniref:Crp/Fnr family transcriptional regulator n=1 Tax=Actinophytocola sp. TaxID=1872138 RepID=UPI002F95FEDC
MDAEDKSQNAILAQLSDDEYTQLRPSLRTIEVRTRQQVYEYREPVDAVYFPLTAVFSMVAMVTSGERSQVEVGTIGFEGMVGLPLFLGSTSSPTATFCQVPGRAVRLAAEDFHEFLTQDGQLHGLLHRYVQTIMVQMSQSVACNVAHLTEQRAARWILTTGDRTRSERFPLTQEFLAQMLGVRRATVSEIAGKLQTDGLITYTRGNLTIVDRPSLTDVACECYKIIKAEFDDFRGAGT